MAAAVAAASLAVTAWGTYKSAQVADDQLAQSRDANEKEAKAQASRISWWIESSDAQDLVFANRSLDPAWIWLYIQTGDQIRTDTGELLQAGELPPCTRISIPVIRVSTTVSEVYKPKSTPSRLSQLIFGIEMAQFDACIVGGELPVHLTLV
ncbi:hypothetical protein, partial [Streptomyces sp. NPDC047453]|uniref:hypothetical protein n=1 Tax=Streptomyces sp. NPDC047453 TaxID=3154812 RepID=UPI00340FD4D3